MLRWHLNFRQISHRFTWSFADPSLQDLNGSHIMYWNMMILNLSRFTVEPHSKYLYFCIQVKTYFHYASRKMPCYFTLDGCAEKPHEMWIGHNIATSRWSTELVLHRLSGARGCICAPQIFFVPKIISYVLKLDQIWWFQYKNGNFFVQHAHFYLFTSRKIFSCPPPPLNFDAGTTTVAYTGHPPRESYYIWPVFHFRF